MGLAIFSALATNRTTHLLAQHAPHSEALTSGFHVALTACSVFLVGAAVIASQGRRARPASAPTSHGDLLTEVA